MEINRVEKYKILNSKDLQRLKKRLNQAEGFNKNLASQIIKLIENIDKKKINNTGSLIEIIDDPKKGGFFLRLKSIDNNIDIDISLYKNYIEMYVAEKLYPIFDSDFISNESKIMQYLKLWFKRDILREIKYTKNSIKSDSYYYYDSGNKIKLHETRDIKQIFKKGQISKIQKYNKWMNDR